MFLGECPDIWSSVVLSKATGGRGDRSVGMRVGWKTMEIIAIRTPSLGDATYVLIVDRHAIVVDPQRDIDRFLEIVDSHDASVSHVLETHMHNDYISGGRDLAIRTGADLVLPAASSAAFSFVPAFHREVLDGPGDVVIEPIHTPGHTPAHTSYFVHRIDCDPAVFTGGSLLVGAAGRSDLLGEEFARSLAKLQYGSLHRLAALPGETGVFPTHGEGSFCSATGAGRSTSTIALEKAENPLYAFPDADSFADDQLGGLVPYPTYYRHMGSINRNNPTAMEHPDVPEMSADTLAAHLEAGGSVLDGRDRHAYARGHIHGSVGIEIGTSFAPWAGWFLPFDAPVALVLGQDDSAVDAAIELAQVGLDDVLGVMRGVDGWSGTGRELASYETVTSADLGSAIASGDDIQVLDVRDPQEWIAGHVEDSVHHYVPDIPAGLPASIDSARPVWVVCRTGNRASIAAGLLERHGLDLIVVTKGGVPDVV